MAIPDEKNQTDRDIEEEFCRLVGEGLSTSAGYNVDLVCLPKTADFSTWVCRKGG